MEPRISIVIPVFNQYPLLHQLLYDIYQKCYNHVDEVLIVNDASTEEDVIGGLDWWKQSEMLPIREIRNKENRGFLLSSNLGLRKATGDIKILISTDVRLYVDVAEKIQSVLKESPKSLVGGVIYSHDTGWNKFGTKIFPYVEGWMLGATADGWEALGYFDERYTPSDYEDVDISTVALQRGYGLAVIEPGSAVHLGGRSIGYSPEREIQTRRNQEKFREKWQHLMK